MTADPSTTPRSMEGTYYDERKRRVLRVTAVDADAERATVEADDTEATVMASALARRLDDRLVHPVPDGFGDFDPGLALGDVFVERPIEEPIEDTDYEDVALPDLERYEVETVNEDGWITVAVAPHPGGLSDGTREYHRLAIAWYLDQGVWGRVERNDDSREP